MQKCVFFQVGWMLISQIRGLRPQSPQTKHAMYSFCGSRRKKNNQRKNKHQFQGLTFAALERAIRSAAWKTKQH